MKIATSCCKVKVELIQNFIKIVEIMYQKKNNLHL